MKLKILNIFLVVSVFTLSTGCSPLLRKDFSQYEDNSGKVVVSYPTNWEKREYVRDSLVFMALSPPDNAQDNFRENFNIVRETAPSYTFEKYYRVNLDSMRTGLADFTVISEGTKTINQRPGKWLIYTHKYEGIALKVKAYFFHDGKTGFVYTATASPDTFRRYEPIFDEIVSTLKLK